MTAAKSIVIIGPGKHFGFELAKRFGYEDFHTLLVARTEESLIELNDKLNKENISCSYVVADATDKTQLSNELRRIAKSIPPIAALIFNVKAGIQGNGLEVSSDQLMQALNTNVGGALTAAQSVLPFMEEGSSIMFTGGGYKDTPDPDKLALSVSKGALHTLFLSLINPLAGRGIKIGTVVIDGVVRKNGPIYPNEVAQAFWDVYRAESGKVIVLD